MTTLADGLLPDQLWQRIQPLLPPPPSHARGGAPRTVPDRACMAAIIGGDHTGANPVDRAKPGCKLHLAVEAVALPLSLLVTGANTNDSLVFEALLDDIPPVRTLPAAGAAAPPRSTPTRPTTTAAKGRVAVVQAETNAQS